MRKRWASVLALGALASPLLGTGLAAAAEREPQQPTPTYLKTLINNRDADEAGSEDRKTDAHLAAAIARIRRAFEDGDARELESSLQQNRRVRVSLQSRSDEAGYFQRGQVRFMFDKLFDERKTRSFTFEPVELDSADDMSAHVHARWSYTVAGDDEEVSEPLRFKLLRRASDWYISEILTAPR